MTKMTTKSIYGKNLLSQNQLTDFHETWYDFVLMLGTDIRLALTGPLVSKPEMHRKKVKTPRASHESQYTRYLAYSDALKKKNFPRTFPMWNSLPSSLVTSKTIEEIKDQI